MASHIRKVQIMHLICYVELFYVSGKGYSEQSVKFVKVCFNLLVFNNPMHSGQLWGGQHEL